MKIKFKKFPKTHNVHELCQMGAVCCTASPCRSTNPICIHLDHFCRVICQAEEGIGHSVEQLVQCRVDLVKMGQGLEQFG